MFDLDQIAAGLPVGEHLIELGEALKTADSRLVVQAPPGSGKTTVVPAVAAQHSRGRVIVTQPRRIAARAAAHRLAQLTGTKLGAEVGFTVRGESKVSRATRVEFVTTGVLVNRLLRDPELTGVSTVILDEVHERHLDTNVAFAMVHDLAELREDLSLIVMSATLAADSWARLVGGTDPARIINVPGALFPLEVQWRPPASSVQPCYAGHLTDDFVDHVARTTVQAATEHGFASDHNASVLVFVPGARDVDRLARRLGSEPSLTGRYRILGLSGAMNPRDQDEVLRGSAEPRIIVSTAIAESSLTVPLVRVVVDAGLSREPRLDAGRGITGLVTVRESKASAEQRAGRAARLGPGMAVRCFAHGDWAGMASDATAEARVSDLVGTTLQLACWGSPRGIGMSLPDLLPAEAVATATAVLQGLGALDEHERPTKLGRNLVRLPLDPRLGRALLLGAQHLGARRAAQITALLASEERTVDGDLAVAWRTLATGRSSAASRWRHESARLERLATETSSATDQLADDVGPTDVLTDTAALGLVAALARPDWIAQRRQSGGRSYLTASGTGVDLRSDCSLEHCQWLAITELTRVDTRTRAAQARHASGSLIRAAVGIDEQLALAAGNELIHDVDQTSWNPDTGRVSTRRQRSLGAITLSSTPVRTTPDNAAHSALTALSTHGLGLDQPGLLHWSPAAIELRNRIGFLHLTAQEHWPAMDQSVLVERASEWLAEPLRTTGSTFDIDVAAALRSLLDWRQLAELDQLAPPHLRVPTGSQITLRYPSPESLERQPVLAVKLQECFGLQHSPQVNGVPVLMELLSPAQRPLARTDDLASFWVNVYPQVRAENRRRYAKHPWPENPLTAPPRRGTTKSGH